MLILLLADISLAFSELNYEAWSKNYITSGRVQLFKCQFCKRVEGSPVYS